jgi:hypothetical protein
MEYNSTQLSDRYKRDRFKMDVYQRWNIGGGERKRENEEERVNKIYQSLGNTTTFFFSVEVKRSL